MSDEERIEVAEMKLALAVAPLLEQHGSLVREIIDAMMASETGARGAESNEEEPHGRPGT